MQVPIRYSCLTAALLLLSAVPAAAQRIAFESSRDGNFEIYSMNADGTQATNLTEDPHPDRLPQWSPDGTKIAFVSERDGNQEVYVMDADGKNKVNLTRQSPARSDANPKWSPDGTKIAYNSNRDGNQEIYIMNADGTNRLKKTSEGGVLSDARWSPSGSHIAYVALRSQKSSIIVMDTVKFEKVNLTLDMASAENPRWSPDGERILFHAGPEGSNEVYVMNSDGSAKTNLTNHLANDGLARWSPDGKRIVLISNRGGDEDIYVANADGSGVTNLTSNAAAEGFIQWSPDGSRIVFSSNRDGGDLELYIMNADGRGLERLTNAPGSDFNPELFGNFSYGQPPAISSGGVVLANLLPQVKTISPLSIVSIFGINFSSETILFPNPSVAEKIATILGGTCVEIGGQRAPIFAMTPTQANVQMPGTLLSGPVGFAVIRECDTPLATRSHVEMATVSEATPGFFIFNPVASNGFIAAQFNDGYAAVAPEGMFTDEEFGPSRPAKPGEIVLLYGTGWGPTGPVVLTTGERAAGAAKVLEAANPTVSLDGFLLAPEDVFYVGVTPGTAGLFQLAIRIPEGTTPGNKQVVLRVYGKATPLGPVIPVAAP
jgi:uncharacterized protein (TIGR03437 family)